MTAVETAPLGRNLKNNLSKNKILLFCCLLFLRPEQSLAQESSPEQLAILQMALRVNPERFGAVYESHRTRLAGSVSVPVAFDSLSTSSYFKFNLIYITFFLIGKKWASWET